MAQHEQHRHEFRYRTIKSECKDLAGLIARNEARTRTYVQLLQHPQTAAEGASIQDIISQYLRFVRLQYNKLATQQFVAQIHDEAASRWAWRLQRYTEQAEFRYQQRCRAARAKARRARRRRLVDKDGIAFLTSSWSSTSCQTASATSSTTS